MTTRSRIAALLSLLALACCAKTPAPAPALRAGSSFSATYAGDSFVLPTTINSVPETFIVDTGATFISLPENDLKKLHLTANGETALATTANGSFQEMTFLTIPELKIGDCTLHNVTAEASSQNMALFGLSGFDHITMTVHGNQMSFACDQ